MDGNGGFSTITKRLFRLAPLVAGFNAEQSPRDFRDVFLWGGMTRDERERLVAAYRQAIADGTEQAPQWDRRLSDACYACASDEEAGTLHYFLTIARVEGYAARLCDRHPSHGLQATQLIPPALDAFEKHLILLQLVARACAAARDYAPFDSLIAARNHPDFKERVAAYLGPQWAARLRQLEEA
jgi:hypothetical protein